MCCFGLQESRLAIFGPPEVSACFAGAHFLDLPCTDLDGRSSGLGHREIGVVVHGRHTITLFRRPRTVHLEACSIALFSSRSSVCGGRLRLMAQLSTGDGRPMEAWVGRTVSLCMTAVSDRSHARLATST